MKFTKSTRLFLSIVFLYLSAFVELTQIQSSLEHRVSAINKHLKNESNNSFGSKKNARSSATTEKSGSKDPAQGCATIYKDCGYSGDSLTVCNDISEYNSDWRNEVSSVRIGPNTRMVVFTNSGYRGHALEITSDVSCLANKGYNDKIEAHYFVGKHCAVFFEDCNYAGDAFKSCQDVGNLGSRWKAGELSSVIVGTETVVELFSQNNYSGERLELRQNANCLANQNFNDKANSVRISDVVKEVPKPIVKPVVYQVPSTPYANFLTGVVQAIAGENSNYSQCLPKELLRNEKESEVRIKALQKIIQFSNSGLQTIRSPLFIETIKQSRFEIVALISGLVFMNINQTKKLRMSFIDISKHSTKEGLSTSKPNYNMIMQSMRFSEIKANDLWDNITNKDFREQLEARLSNISLLVSNMKALFKSNSLNTVVEILNCISSGSSSPPNVKTIINGFKDKLNILKRNESNQLTHTITIVDFIVGWVFNSEKHKSGMNHFSSAWKNKEFKNKFLLYGKAIGTFFSAVGSANTYANSYGKIQDLIKKHQSEQQQQQQQQQP